MCLKYKIYQIVDKCDCLLQRSTVLIQPPQSVPYKKCVKVERFLQRKLCSIRIKFAERPCSKAPYIYLKYDD